ncbi:MAG: MFS transporter [Chloroflexi bacterium]|nr:MFS transporter [Chloroflexota bacterium]MQC48067.1 MFS transporter [Chloroflexota bacterium]
MSAFLRNGVGRRPGLPAFEGWRIVLACSAVGAYGGGVYFYGFTLFFNPLRDELGLTSTQTSLIFSLTRLEGAFEGALVGFLIDRFGARRVMMAGVPIAGVGFLLWATIVHSYLAFALVYVGIIATGINAGFFHPALTVANNWFIRRRATAMQLLGVSQGLGGATLVPLVGISIATFGWRPTAFMAGLGLLLFIWPLTLLIHHRPEDRGLLPDGDPPPEELTPGASDDGLTEREPTPVRRTVGASPIDFTVKEAFRTKALWVLTFAITIRLFTHTAVMVHLAPMLISHGFGTVAAGGAVGLLSFATIPSRLLAGWLGDRFTKRKVIAGLLMSDALALVVLMNATSFWHIYGFIFLWASGYGAGLLNWAVVGDYFGRAKFATIRGMMGAVFSFGGMVGPLFAGWTFDTNGDYQNALRVFFFVTLAAAALYFFGRPPDAPDRPAPDEDKAELITATTGT